MFEHDIILCARFGDLFGGRMALTLAFASCAVQYGIMSVTYTIPLLFLSRLPSAFMHAMQGKCCGVFS